MKKSFVIVFCLLTYVCNAQTEAPKIYHPEADAEKDIAAAIKKAKAENKYVLVQGGGNWYGWCIEFTRFCKADPKIDSVMNVALCGIISTTVRKIITNPYLQSMAMPNDLTFRCSSY